MMLSGPLIVRLSCMEETFNSFIYLNSLSTTDVNDVPGYNILSKVHSDYK